MANGPILRTINWWVGKARRVVNSRAYKCQKIGCISAINIIGNSNTVAGVIFEMDYNYFYQGWFIPIFEWGDSLICKSISK